MWERRLGKVGILWWDNEAQGDYWRLPLSWGSLEGVGSIAQKWKMRNSKRFSLFPDLVDEVGIPRISTWSCGDGRGHELNTGNSLDLDFRFIGIFLPKPSF